jgi:hypothetical protein
MIQIRRDSDNGRLNSVEQRDNFVGFGGRLGYMVHGGGDSPTMRVPKDNNQLSVQMARCVFNAGCHVCVDNISSDANDKQVAKSLIKD